MASTTRTCGFPGCDRPHSARGWCTTHWTRWRKYGDPSVTKKAVVWGDVETKLLAKREIASNGCWLWTDHVLPHVGYANVSYRSRKVRVHRLAYEHWNGPIPDGMTVDHECHNRDLTCAGGKTCLHRRCFNPEHLVLRTSGDNRRAALR